MSTIRVNRVGFWRHWVQWLFLGWIGYIGIRFGMFVRHFDSHGVAPLVSRPPGVEGFLPIGGLASLKLWLFTGTFDLIHPAALVLLTTFLLMSLIAKKSFCAWLCPVGSISEAMAWVGRKVLGRNFIMWPRLDVVLRVLKYLLLAFFVKILLIDMSVFAISAFLHSPYWKMADVKMLRFFTHISTLSLIIVVTTALLSLVYKNFWCRYLCPYGALLGLVSMFSLFKIRRDTKSCTDCRQCSAACPALIQVHGKIRVADPECIGCMSCVDACQYDSLAMGTALNKKPMPRWVFPLVVLAVYAAGVSVGMISGHWESVLTNADYQQLIPMVGRLNH